MIYDDAEHKGLHDDQPLERPPVSGSRGIGPRGLRVGRRVGWRTVLSALAGGGLTVAGLGGPLAGGALGAEAPPEWLDHDRRRRRTAGHLHDPGNPRVHDRFGPVHDEHLDHHAFAGPC